MSGMEPMLIGAALGGGVSAAQGGNPLTGALLGGITGGIGAGAAGAATGTGIGAGGASLPGVMGASNTAAGVAAQSALPTGLGGGLPSMIPNMVSTPFSSLAPTAGGMGSAGSFMAGQSGLGGIEQFMQQNPYTTRMGMDYLQNQMQPEPPMAMAQSQGLLRGTQMQPQGQQYQVGVPQFSLI
jgi:hypothetical protein